MKKILFFSFFVLLNSSCGNSSGKYKTQIEELSSQWGETTTAVTDFSVAIKMEQAELLNLTTKLNVEPNVIQGWPEEKSIRYNNIKATTQNYSNSLATLSDDVDKFISTWVDKGKQVKGLKDGVSRGSLSGNVEAELGSLSSTANEAGTKLDTWKQQLSELKAGIQEAANSYNELQN